MPMRPEVVWFAYLCVERGLMTREQCGELRKQLGDATFLVPIARTARMPRPAVAEVTRLIARMDAQEARHRRELAAYREQVRDLAGKRIEGTGAIQVGYFTHLLILAIIVAVAWVVLKVVAMANAPVAVGMKTIEGGSRFLGRAFAEVVEGGEEWDPVCPHRGPRDKDRIRKRLAGSPEVLAAVLEEFQAAHRARQSRDVQEVVQKSI